MLPKPKINFEPCYRYNCLSVITPRTNSHGSPRNWVSNFTRIVRTQVKFCEIWHLFSLALIQNFLWCSWLQIAYYKYSPWKIQKKNAILFKLYWFKVFVQWKLELLNFLMDSVLIPLYSPKGRPSGVFKTCFSWLSWKPGPRGSCDHVCFSENRGICPEDYAIGLCMQSWLNLITSFT